MSNEIKDLSILDELDWKVIEAVFDYTSPSNIHKKVNLTNKSILKRLKKLQRGGFVKKLAEHSFYYIDGTILLNVNYKIKGLSENTVYESDVESLLTELNSNSEYIALYGFTEMLNNVIDHSNGKSVQIMITDNFCGYGISIFDDGIGIFKKIKKVLRLTNESESVLQLSKGKLTTDKKNHTGQGIFFTSRMVDHFTIASGDNWFSHDWDKSKDVLRLGNPNQKGNKKGTMVMMSFRKKTNINPLEVYKKYTSADGEATFQKTIVPIILAKYATGAMLVSRSQAKMVYAGLNDFTEIVLDFADVKNIGQAFADEIFRVYQNRNPNKKISWMNANKEILFFINRALSR